ncbi:nuclear cap-binding protein subunit 3-like [Prorops nasuta]|uniref:nuclear cap-binding protein subunit 3-like n=1 Tax=Prorops nasuta TaxID=863751 RepID=UPI0034CF71F9
MNEFDEDVEMTLVDDSNLKKSLKTDETFENVQIFQVTVPEMNFENHGKTFTTGVDIFSTEENLKKEERIKRFGLADKLKTLVSNNDKDLYTSMGITNDSEVQKNTRLNVIHIRGTENMSTQDVFKYFEAYAPTSIEWINDISCNVVWLDAVTAARAMLGLSKKIIGLNKNEQNIYLDNKIKQEGNGSSDNKMQINTNVSNEKTNELEKSEDSVHIKDIQCPLPPGLWRKGIDYPKSKGIFLRFATKNDRKQPNSEKMSEYYKKHGNPNFGGIKGILTESCKKMYKQGKYTKRARSELDEDVDGETNRKRIKNPWGALSQNWGVNDSVEDDFVNRGLSVKEQGSIKERLGIKQQVKDIDPVVVIEDSTSEESSEEEWCKRSKVLRMRMHADDEEKKLQKKKDQLQTQSTYGKVNKTKDLRSRLGKGKQETPFRDTLQVVVTNTNANNFKMSKKVVESEEEDGEIVEEDDDDEEEEGENEEEENKYMQEVPSELEAEEEEDEEESKESYGLATEAQGPRGSVIKVVPQKPRVASTVWTRLNNVKSATNSSFFKQGNVKTRDLRNTLKGDLRSRIGNNASGRSSLRIEVKNDKYTKRTG